MGYYDDMEMLATIITLLMKFLKSVIFTLLTFFACHLNRSILTAFAAVGLLRRPSSDERGGEAEDDETAASNYVVIMKGAVPSLVHMNILKRRLKQRIPVVVVRRHGAAAEEDDEAACSVCLNGLEEGEEVKELSNCRHVFHRECIDCWVDGGHFTCPICRSLIFSNEIAPNVVVTK